MSASHRLPLGGLIDRERSLAFTFNSRRCAGHPGDTLASALLANGVRLVGRSFKYHRPRGIFTAGSEEPNALVTLGRGAEAEPNTRATVIELREGLCARSQNHRGPLGFDLMAATDLLSPFLGSGFYYKTFMWPGRWWERLYEPAIRRAAGLGRLSGLADPGLYDKGYLHCDVLVIGAGPAGLSAALAAGRAGARVVLADEDFLMGGRLNAERHEVDGQPGSAWAEQVRAELAAMPHVRVMPRTTVFGVYDHGIHGAVEHTAPDRLTPDRPRQVLWRIYARQSVLCAGATERPLIFPGNDRPGVMLAGAVQAYANRWAVTAGSRVAVYTNNSSGAQIARDLQGAGIEVVQVLDARTGAHVHATRGRMGLREITLADGTRAACDCLAVSGGWSPNLHLACHTGDKPLWREDIQAFVPGARQPRGMQVAGAANGAFALAEALAQGDAAGRAAAEASGYSPAPPLSAKADDTPVEIGAFWHVADAKGRAWVDLQNDVTTKDIALACKEGFRAVEHLKRYTTLGMATDQGRTSNVPGLAILAGQTGRSLPEVGTTRYRPPFTPVSIGAFAGHERGREFRPVRHTPAHDWAVANDASFVESGLWLRAEWFARPGETGWRDSVDREVTQTRSSVGICDVSTLGKIDIQGSDAGRFVDFVYCNGFAKLSVGRVRYGLMLREDGMVMDDGTTARLAELHYLMTTTTANAAPVYRHLEFVRQCLTPGWDVHLVPETDAWAQFSVAGPDARRLLAKLVDPPFDISNEAFPFMACAELTICGGVRARLFRISFSGELGYEIAVPAGYGGSLAEVLMQAGEAFGAVPYGVEALDVMRVEKGHPAGNELNGQTTPESLAMDRMVSKRKDFIGCARTGHSTVDGLDGLQLVGLVPVDRARQILAGAHILGVGAAPTLAADQGWVSSTAYSPILGHHIGLGFVKDGAAREGERLRAVDLVRGTDILVEITSPRFVDPQGARLHD